MSAQLLYLGDCIINLAHVVKADFKPVDAGGEERYDEDSGQTYNTRPKKASLRITLTALEIENYVEDFERSGWHQSSAGVSQVKTLYGDAAERAWDYLCNQAVGLGIVDESKVAA